MKDAHINDLDLNPRIAKQAIQGGMLCVSDVLKLNNAELQSRTGLNSGDIDLLVKSASMQLCPAIHKALDLQMPKGISLGCKNLDTFFVNGFPIVGITEVCGESGAGKTQLALQLAIQAQSTNEGCGKAVVFICTEGQFKINRFNQIASHRNINTYNGKNVSDNLLIHHISDMDELCDCVQFQLENIIHKNKVGTVIIDSVAAIFRADDRSLLERSRAISRLGYMLHQIAHKYSVAIIAVNQVTAMLQKDIYGIRGDVIPALGLSWSNHVTTRIMLSKTDTHTNTEKLKNCKIRILQLVSCPWLPRACLQYIITEAGVVGLTNL